MPRIAATTLIAIILLGTAGQVFARAKTDVVVLKNGDRITCEIKGLTRGKLKVNTDSAGLIDIEWDDIVALKSAYYFRVEVSAGRRFFGALELVDSTTTLRIVRTTEIISLEKENVVEITPIEHSFWSRFDGSAKVGYEFTKASDVAKFYFDWKNYYRTERNYFDTRVNFTHTDRGDEDGIKLRNVVSADYTRLLRRKWTGTVTASLERNDEVNLAHRLLVSIGSGSSLIRTNHDILLVSAGVALNSELATDSTNTAESVELVFSGSYSRFIYDTPKTQISLDLDFYPSLTEKDRYRLNTEIVLSREIISDLFFDLSYYINYDNKGASGEGSTQDYAIVTSFGWTY